MDPEKYASFVVRIWRDQSSGEQLGHWCGEIEQIQSGERWPFNTLSDLLAFLQQAVTTQASCQWRPEDQSV